MATPGELIKVVSDALGIPEATVTTYYRSLRETGWVTKGGRGASAAKMTPRDAAYLLIAAGGSRFEKEPAAKIVQSFEHVQAMHGAWREGSYDPAATYQTTGDWNRTKGEWKFDGFALPRLTELPSEHSIGDALVALIQTAMDGGFETAHSARHPDSDAWTMIEVSFFGPKPAAGIEILITIPRVVRREEETAYLSTDPVHPNTPNGDLEIRRKFTWKTIYKVADLLKS